jgi:Phage major capsid protein E
MSRIYTIPTNLELRPPIQNYVQNVDSLLGMQLIPVENSFAQVIETEEIDHDDGMTAAHLLGTEPKIDARPASKKFRYEPLYFKETDVLNEADILRARKLGTFGTPISLTEEITKIAKRRAEKTMVRIEWSIWQMLGGRLQYTDNKVKVDEQWTGVQSHSPIADWDELEDATPLDDLDMAGDKFDGTGASMEGAIIVANRQTWRLMMKNQNDTDLKALDKTMWGNFRFMFGEMAKIVQDKCGATLKSYDKGYYEGGAFKKYLPTGEIRIIGKRDFDEKVGKWWSVPSLHITDAAGNEQPGYFVLVEANGQESTGSVAQIGNTKNPKVEITGGIYGGPNLDYEDNVIKLKVVNA